MFFQVKRRLKNQIALSIICLFSIIGLTPLHAQYAPPLAPPPPTYDFGPRVPVVTDWNGPYFGVAAGLTANSVRGINSLTSIVDTYQASGLHGSVLAGVNLQLGPVVVGAEGDLTLLQISNRVQQVAGSITSKVDWSASLRARLGIPLAQFLVYGTAGVAFTNVSLTAQSFGRDSEILKGWVLGGGLETAIFGGWRLRGEYLYSKADSNRFTFGTGPTFSADNGNHTVRAALVVRFGN